MLALPPRECETQMNVDDVPRPLVNHIGNHRYWRDGASATYRLPKSIDAARPRAGDNSLASITGTAASTRQSAK